MSAYSVAAAKAGLARLIDRALAGEEVIITGHRKPVAELRPAAASVTTACASLLRLAAVAAPAPGRAAGHVRLTARPDLRRTEKVSF